MIRRAFLVVLAAAVAACASGNGPNDAPKMPKSEYKGEVGASPVGVIPDAPLHDDERNRDVRITLEYPTRSTNNPLIVLSPAYGLNNNAYVALSSYWASQGYVVLRIAHADSGKQPDGDIWQTLNASDHRNRVRDVTFVLDSLDRLEETYPELKEKIDREKIGVAGHSYGAYTAMLLGGVKTFPGAVQYADARVKVVVAMSPQGPAELNGLTDESWSDVHVPMLFMTGSQDQGFREAETPDWRQKAFELASPGDKWLVVIDNVRHATFVGRYDAIIEAQARERDVEAPAATPGTGPFASPAPPETRRLSSGNAPRAAMQQRVLIGTIKTMSLAFFDAYLKGEAPAREALVKAQTSGGMVVKTK